MTSMVSLENLSNISGRNNVDPSQEGFIQKTEELGTFPKCSMRPAFLCYQSQRYSEKNRSLGPSISKSKPQTHILDYRI